MHSSRHSLVSQDVESNPGSDLYLQALGVDNKTHQLVLVMAQCNFRNKTVSPYVPTPNESILGPSTELRTVA